MRVGRKTENTINEKIDAKSEHKEFETNHSNTVSTHNFDEESKRHKKATFADGDKSLNYRDEENDGKQRKPGEVVAGGLPNLNDKNMQKQKERFMKIIFCRWDFMT